MGLIYKVTSPSGKVYIGKTVQTLSRRKAQHKCSAFLIKEDDSFVFNTKFCKSIRKYGFENFKWEVLHDNVEILSELSKLEELEIERYNSCISGYNIENNSSVGGHRSKETKRKISLKVKGHIGSKNPAKFWLNKRRSEETKQKISQTLKAKGHKVILTPEIIVKAKETRYRNWLLKSKIIKIKVPKIRTVWNSGENHQYAKIYYIETPQKEILEFRLKSSVIQYFKNLSDSLNLSKFKRISGKHLLERGYSQGYKVIARKRIRETL